MSRRYTYAGLENLWTAARGSAAMAPEMAAIAEVESAGNGSPTPGKIGNNPDTPDGLPGAVGLWQIEWPLHAGLAGTTRPEQLLDPMTNARAAVELAGGDPSTSPGHPVYDNWIQWEKPANAYLKYLQGGSPTGFPIFQPGTSSPGQDLGPLQLPGFGVDVSGLPQMLLIGLLVAAGAAAAVIGAARAAKGREAAPA